MIKNCSTHRNRCTTWGWSSSAWPIKAIPTYFTAYLSSVVRVYQEAREVISPFGDSDPFNDSQPCGGSEPFGGSEPLGGSAHFDGKPLLQFSSRNLWAAILNLSVLICQRILLFSQDAGPSSCVCRSDVSKPKHILRCLGVLDIRIRSGSWSLPYNVQNPRWVHDILKW